MREAYTDRGTVARNVSSKAEVIGPSHKSKLEDKNAYTT